MNVVFMDQPLHLRLTGVVHTHDPSKSYGEEIVALLDQVWGPIRAHHIAHKGINHVLYGAADELFAGVETDVVSPERFGLIVREWTIARYGSCKHKGPYAGLPNAHAALVREFRRLGLRQGLPVIEIYGHWTDNEAELETEVIYPIAE